MRSCLDYVLIESKTISDVKTFVAFTLLTDHYSYN